MERICNCCNISKPISDFRDTRKKCKLCDNKRRYIQKMERRKNDPEYHKELKAYDVKRKRRREKENPIHGATQSLRSLVRSINNKRSYKKNSSLSKHLGIPVELFIPYIESRFLEGMTWSNYGEWEYDHIIPVSLYKSEEWVNKSCYYKNFQPLWKDDNRAKGDNIFPLRISNFHRFLL